MKLIIDIPDNQYNQICELRLHNRTIYDDAIRNGIPFEKIRAEIDGIEINGRIDEHTMFIRTGEHVKKMALDIIDRYTKGESL